ncbi:MAG: hypothetical protein KME49_19795 [Brasilonema octagenarum HA4186-MV1]|jgi:hypothetical protein|uniref:Uncharacterized protein n=2 Tax=Brasilonema TaxID=383614 RepID=A0A856MCZ2_9CYAN|nr:MULTISPECIES: hypothetical protein [Brasilonema]MBW4627682.1 hypothetical protein [Brasilonema octagenarum HA4186-MV1]NMF65198.1 hypothetical protein [Brasilonema octagenarum UFV-OR1]QDL08204.1 hypothetical protein DP114_10085 [Brasilonema sennae CENA114]QDL14560.1 hypothetical protein DP113_10030 [Brasilonema octagenarum UFV-E1]
MQRLYIAVLITVLLLSKLYYATGKDEQSHLPVAGLVEYFCLGNARLCAPLHPEVATVPLDLLGLGYFSDEII